MDLLSRPVLPADHRIPYGPGQFQFGDLWLPAAVPSGRLLPVAAFFHGGWWKSAYDLGYAGYLCRALRQAGVAVWSIEYRRVGTTGGGFPETFQDAADGFDFLGSLAKTYPLDLSRVIVLGHSAGGHLAFWTAGRHHVAPGSVLHREPRIALLGALALAGAVDLGLTIELSGTGEFAHDCDEVFALMGGTPHQVPDRFAVGDPGALLPLQGKQVLLQGTRDDQIPPTLPTRFVEKARRAGSEARAQMLSRADHFDVVDPESRAWPAVLAEVKALLDM